MFNFVVPYAVSVFGVRHCVDCDRYSNVVFDSGIRYSIPVFDFGVRYLVFGIRIGDGRMR